jgi:hypothetical protein
VKTVTLFIIYYLYTFNDNATLHAELTSLLDKAHQELESNFMLPEDFKHLEIPEINIRQGIPKLPGQPGAQFCNYSREMQEAQRAHLIECNVQAIPFLRLLVNNTKDQKLAAPIWGGHPISLKQLIGTHQRAMSASLYGCPRITCVTT